MERKDPFPGSKHRISSNVTTRSFFFFSLFEAVIGEGRGEVVTPVKGENTQRQINLRHGGCANVLALPRN